MTSDEIVKWLEDELAIFPQRAAGEELYNYLTNRTNTLVKSDRESLVGAVRVWLKLRSEPRTMLAVEFIEKYHLTELKGEIEDLLTDVKNGTVFKPYYTKPISKALDEI